MAVTCFPICRTEYFDSSGKSVWRLCARCDPDFQAGRAPVNWTEPAALGKHVYLVLHDLEEIIVGVYDSFETAVEAHPGNWKQVTGDRWRDGVNAIERQRVITRPELRVQPDVTTQTWPPSWMTWSDAR